MLRKYPLGTSATFRGTMRVRTLTHGPSESPSSNFLQLSIKVPHASAAVYSEFFHLPHHSFRRTFRKVSAQSFHRTFPKTFHRKLLLDFPQGFCTDACRECCQSPGLTYAEIGLTDRLWTDAHKQSDRKLFRQVFAGAPCLGAPL